jgi:hypothetical protein
MCSPGSTDCPDGTVVRRLGLSLRFLYNRPMALDPANPPIWLRKLHVTAAQISADDYAPTPEQGIVECCRLSDAMQRWSKACAQALGLSPLPCPPPFENPFRRVSPIDRAAAVSPNADTPR